MSRLGQIGKDSLVYGLGGILARGIGILLLPVYTRLFPPAAYGTIEMLMTTSNLLGALMVMGMDSAQSFYFFKCKEGGTAAQSQVVSAIFQWRLLWGLACIVLSTLLAPPLNLWLFGGKLQLAHFVFAFGAAFCLQMMMQAAELFRLLFRPWSYVIVTAVHGILTGISILAALALFDLGILGYFVGSFVASMLLMIVAWWMARDHLRRDCGRRHWWPQLIRFGWPLLPAALAYYVMSVADRWFIQYFAGPIELGHYAVAAKLGVAMVLVIETFRKAWWPIAMDAMHSDDGPQTFRLIARLYLGIGTVGVLCVTTAAPLLIRWLAAPAYFDAFPLVGIMAWQALFYGAYLIVSAGIWKSERTSLSAWLMGGGAVVNAALCYVLVPLWAGLGAALATAVTYFIWIITSYIVAEQFWPVRLPTGPLSGILALGLGAHGLLYWAQAQALWIGSAVILLASAPLIAYLALEPRTRLNFIRRLGVHPCQQTPH